MLFKKLLIIVGFLSVVISSFGSEKVVSVATLEDYSPFCFTVNIEQSGLFGVFPPGIDSKKFKGYSWDVLRESFHVMGYTIHLSVTPWARAMAYVKNGQADVLFPAGKNSERQKIFYYSKNSINPAVSLVYIRSDSLFNWTGLESLKGLTIGEKRGFYYGEGWKVASYFEKYPISKILQGFNMLDQKRIDG